MAQFPLLVYVWKYKVNPPDIVHFLNNFIWLKPQAMPFELVNAYNFSELIIEGSTRINFRVELDDPLNFISSSGSIEIDEPTDPDALAVLDLNDLENLLVVQIYNGDTLSGEFLGIIDPSNSYFDNIEKTYHLYFYDLFSYVYNQLPNYLATITKDGVAIGDKLPYYTEIFDISQTDIPLDFFLRTYNSVSDDVSAEVDIPFTVNVARMVALVGQVSINYFLDQIRNHYGAYFIIDGNKTARFISRSKGRLNEAVDITDDIVEDEYTENYTMPAEYNAVRCSAIIDDPDGTTIVDHLIYYDGELKHKFIYYNTDLSSFDYLDLRVSFPLSGVQQYYVLPNRSIDDLKEIYGHITMPQNIVKCKVARVDLPILYRVSISGVEYTIMEMEKNYEEEYSVLELLRK